MSVPAVHSDPIIARKVSEDYWIKTLKEVDYFQLDTYTVSSSFSTDGTDRYREISLNLSESITTRLNEITRGDRKSIFVLLGTALAILHARYTGSRDILFNSPPPGTTGEGDGVKLFYRIEVGQHDMLREVLAKVQQNVMRAFEHRYYDTSQLIERFRRNKTGNEKALSQIGLVLESLHKNIADYNNELTFIVNLNGQSYIRFDTILFDERLVKQYATHFVRVLTAVLTENKQVALLELLDDGERRMLTTGFNNTGCIIPEGINVVTQFRKTCAVFPDRVAIQTPLRQITFRELQQYSDNLAVYLQHHLQVKREQVISILLDRNEWAIAAMIGVLKAGCAYLPVDPKYPPERIQFLIDDSQSSVVLTEEKYLNTVNHPIVIDVKPVCKNTSTVIDEVIPVNMFQLAYIIYTSGSTGNPKGVLIEHAGLFNHINWFNRQFAVTERDSTILVTSFSFDGSVTYIWSCLTTGATVHILPDERIIDPDYLLRYMHRQQITFLKLVPSFFALLINSTMFEENGLLDAVRFIKLGGEAINVADVSKYLSRYPDTILANHYGPTEATIGATVQLITPDSLPDFARLPVIGAPFDNCEIYILNTQQELVPAGVVGEIYIGGAGVARGYQNRPELTAEKFLENPFRKGGRIYRTGDMACWTTDGKIVFKGREDFQVKIKGYRIELQEIENVLQQYPFIKQAVVLPAQDNQSLIAYLCGKTGITLPDLRNFLEARLPAFMIPGAFTLVDHIPLTLNRKVDRRALLSLRGRPLQTSAFYVAPRTEAEEVLVTVFEDILKSSPVGIKDNFFSLGGDSIKAILIISRLKQKDFLLSIPDILNFPVLEELAARMVKSSVPQNFETVTGKVPPGPAQLAFLESNVSNKHTFHQSVILYRTEGIAEDTIRKVLSVLWKHHDALRMVYNKGVDGWEQVCQDETADYGWQEIDLRNVVQWKESITIHHRNMIEAMDITTGPLLQACLFHCPDGARLLLVIHHLVVDGVSWRILLEDLSQLYQQQLNGEIMLLPPKTDSFKQWQKELAVYAQSETLLGEVPYWNNVLAQELLPLRADMEEGDNTKNAVESFTLDEHDTLELTSAVHTAYGTNTNDILLTALAKAVKDVSGIGRFMVVLEGHGREMINESTDVSRTVGWFTSKYPVIIEIPASDIIAEEVIAVKESLHRIPRKGMGYGVLRYLNKGGLNNYPLVPGIVFNYLGDFGTGTGEGEGNGIFSLTNDLLDKQIIETGDTSERLRISALIAGHSFKLSVTYSTNQYHTSTITRLVTQYKAHLQMLIKELACIYQNTLTPSDLSFKELSIQALNNLNSKNDVEDVYPLTPLQQGLYFLWLVDPASYLQQISYSIEGTLDLTLLERCYNLLLQRHAMLRVSFTGIDGEQILQVVKRDKWIPVELVDMTSLHIGYDGLADFQEQYKKEKRQQGIDLHQDRLFTLTVIKYSETLHSLIWRWHHIICDGWSMSILMTEFTGMYAKLSGGEEWSSSQHYSYATYIRWLQEVNREHTLSYWRKYLEGYVTHATLPLLDTNTGANYHFRERYLWIKEEKANRLGIFCKQAAITENTFFTGAWSLLLAKYNHSSDVVFGTVVSGRPPDLPGIERMVGLFINTIPVRVQLNPQITVTRLMQQIQKEAAESTAHHYVQLAEIQSCSKLNKSLLNHILIFENYPVEEERLNSVEEMQVQNTLSIRSVNEMRQNQTNYPFNIVINPSATRIEVAFTFNELALPEDVVYQMMNDFDRLIEQILISPENKVLSFQFNFYLENGFSREQIPENDLEESF